MSMLSFKNRLLSEQNLGQNFLLSEQLKISCALALQHFPSHSIQVYAFAFYIIAETNVAGPLYHPHVPSAHSFSDAAVTVAVE